MAPDEKRAGEQSPARFLLSARFLPSVCNKQFTRTKSLGNNSARYYNHRFRIAGQEAVRMIVLAAVGAFLGLFTLWVVLPRKFIQRGDR